MTVLAVAIGFVLTLLALIHVYWALGGRCGLALAIPELRGDALRAIQSGVVREMRHDDLVPYSSCPYCRRISC